MTKPKFTFNLKKEWYNKIAAGEKRVEYREAKDYWNRRLGGAVVGNQYKGAVVRFVLGYTKTYMDFEIVSVHLIYAYEQRDLIPSNPKTELYAIKFKDVEK